MRKIPLGRRRSDRSAAPRPAFTAGHVRVSGTAWDGFVLTREGGPGARHFSASLVGGWCAAPFGYPLARAFR